MEEEKPGRTIAVINSELEKRLYASDARLKALKDRTSLDREVVVQMRLIDDQMKLIRELVLELNKQINRIIKTE